MPYVLNRQSLERLKASIRAGKFTDEPFRFSPADSNALLGDPKNWTEYSLSFLGIGVGVALANGMNDAVMTKADFFYCYGKDGEASLDALRQIVEDASNAGENDIADAAQEQLDAGEAMIADSKVASGISRGSYITMAAPATIRAGATAGRIPTFTSVAYTGGPMQIDGFNYPVVVDLDGMDFTGKPRPVLRDHDPERPVGHTTDFEVANGQLEAAGEISVVSDDAQEVAASGKNGFPWQVSIGARVITSEFIPRGSTGQANGRTFPGPVIIARTTELREISLLSLGADDNTSAKIAASANQRNSMLTTFSRTRPVITAKAIAAAACRSMLHIPDAELLKDYGQRAIEAADSLGCIGLKGIYALCADTENARYEFGDGDDVIRAATSTESLPAVLQNIANKAVIKAYEAVGGVADVICSQGADLKDFRSTGRIRLTGHGQFERVSPSGEVPQFSVTDSSSYSIAANTYGSLLGIDRTMVVNDDAGAFLSLPKVIGRSAAMVKEQELFRIILANANSFFGSGNKNYISGSGTIFSGSAVAKLSKTFREQIDENGNLLLQVPRFVLVPPALEEAALVNYRNTAVGAGAYVNDGSSELPDNIPIARYTPVVAPYLGLAGGLSGASDVSWYIFGNPNDVAAFEIAYLGGQKYPQFRPCPPRAETLSTELIAMFDFGIAQADPRGAAMSLADS